MAEDREGLDLLQADMAEHQRRFRGDVTASLNQAMAAQAFERLDRERSERPSPPPSAISPVAVQAPVEHKTERKDVDGKTYLLSTSPTDDIQTRPASPAEIWYLAHALPRIELLLTKLETGPLGQPSWAQRVMAVFERKAHATNLKASGHHDLAAMADRQYMLELSELLEASSAPFGDWKADIGKKLIVSG